MQTSAIDIDILLCNIYIVTTKDGFNFYRILNVFMPLKNLKFNLVLLLYINL